MIGKNIDVTNFTREEAIDYIKNRCNDCDIRINCNGNDSAQCNAKIEYLKNKYKTWKTEIAKIVHDGCSDSDIEDFIELHPELNGKQVWDYVYEIDAPSQCKGCEHIQMQNMYPCDECTRNKRLKDHYKARQQGDT